MRDILRTKVSNEQIRKHGTKVLVQSLRDLKQEKNAITNTIIADLLFGPRSHFTETLVEFTFAGPLSTLHFDCISFNSLSRCLFTQRNSLIHTMAATD